MGKKIQERKINPLPAGVKISMFDKSKNKMDLLNKGINEPHNQVAVNTPQFRINQHKGA